MGTASSEEYAAFLEKVKRTVYIDNLSPQVTDSVLKTAFGQFGTVISTQFIPNYLESRNIPQCALVEMENEKQANVILTEMKNFPFMMSGMPRPVRGREAEVEMFHDRPIKPGRKIQCQWVDPKDPNFEVAKKLKRLTKKHAVEASVLLQKQLEEEEKLATQQSETLKSTYKKLDMIESILLDGTVKRLAKRYDFNIVDD